MSAEEILDIVNENDEVIGNGTRQEIHAKGLLHRVVDVWFYNKNGEVLLQKRSLKKDTAPGCLGFSVGGHVDSGSTVHEALFREAQEETGLILQKEDCIFIDKVYLSVEDKKTNVIENQIKNIFAYEFTGEVKDLVFDPDEVEGFEWLKAEKLFSLSPEEKGKFGNSITHEKVLETLKKVLMLK